MRGMKQQDARNFVVILVLDGLALLAALYYSFHTVTTTNPTTGAPLHLANSGAARAAWGFFVLMLVVTGLFYWLSREEEVHHGLPPEGGLDEEQNDK